MIFHIQFLALLIHSVILETRSFVVRPPKTIVNESRTRKITNAQRLKKYRSKYVPQPSIINNNGKLGLKRTLFFVYSIDSTKKYSKTFNWEDILSDQYDDDFHEPNPNTISTESAFAEEEQSMHSSVFNWEQIIPSHQSDYEQQKTKKRSKIALTDEKIAAFFETAKSLFPPGALKESNKHAENWNDHHFDEESEASYTPSYEEQQISRPKPQISFKSPSDFFETAKSLLPHGTPRNSKKNLEHWEDHASYHGAESSYTPPYQEEQIPTVAKQQKSFKTPSDVSETAKSSFPSRSLHETETYLSSLQGQAPKQEVRSSYTSSYQGRQIPLTAKPPKSFKAPSGFSEKSQPSFSERTLHESEKDPRSWQNEASYQEEKSYYSPSYQEQQIPTTTKPSKSFKNPSNYFETTKSSLAPNIVDDSEKCTREDAPDFHQVNPSLITVDTKRKNVVAPKPRSIPTTDTFDNPKSRFPPAGSRHSEKANPRQNQMPTSEAFDDPKSYFPYEAPKRSDIPTGIVENNGVNQMNPSFSNRSTVKKESTPSPPTKATYVNSAHTASPSLTSPQQTREGADVLDKTNSFSTYTTNRGNIERPQTSFSSYTDVKGSVEPALPTKLNDNVQQTTSSFSPSVNDINYQNPPAPSMNNKSELTMDNNKPITSPTTKTTTASDMANMVQRNKKYFSKKDQSALKRIQYIWEKLSPIAVQGGTVRTCSFYEHVERVQIFLRTDGRPLSATVDLWQGPNNAPHKMRVYIEDGSMRPFNCVVETPGTGNAIAIENTANMEYPLSACVEANVEGGDPAKKLSNTGVHKIIQGGAVYTTAFAPSVASVKILMETDARPLDASIEILQGPNNSKQRIDVYTQNGMERPFYAIIETPGDGTTIRIVNNAPMEFPVYSIVEANSFDSANDPFLHWD